MVGEPRDDYVGTGNRLASGQRTIDGAHAPRGQEGDDASGLGRSEQDEHPPAIA